MSMTKHLLIMAIFSVLAVYFVKQIDSILYGLGYAQAFLTTGLSSLLPQSSLTRLISEVVILLIIPIVIGLIIPFVYGVSIYKEVLTSPKFMWIVWLISLIIFVTYV